MKRGRFVCRLFVIIGVSILGNPTCASSQGSVPMKHQERPGRMDSLVARGLDPRLSRIIPDSAASGALAPPVLLPEPRVPTTPRRERLRRGEAVISPNIRVHPNALTEQSEMTIATHPTDPDIVLAGSNATHTGVLFGSQGWYYTTDGGKSWTGRDTLPTHSNHNLFMSDPAVGIDLDGHLMFGAMLFGSVSGDVITARSTDQGTSWKQTAIPNLSANEDKNHLVVDVNPGSPYLGRVYAAYTDFDPRYITSPIMFSRSTDNGQTFASPEAISNSVGMFFAQGVNLAVGPSGELYAAWSGYDDFPDTATHLGFNTSTDGGATWTGGRSLRIVNDIRGVLKKPPNSVRVNSFPSMAVDVGNGSRRGWIYIVYAERRGAAPEIVLVRSTDGGATWSPPVKVNQDASGRDHWFPWISVDPVTGGLYVVYYDSRNFTANDSAQVYVSSSYDGGETFEDLLVSDVPFLPKPIAGLASGYMGDYIGISALDGIAWPCWNDNRTGIQQAYTSRIVFLQAGTPPTIRVTPDTLDFGKMYLAYPETLAVKVRNMGFPDTLTVEDAATDTTVFLLLLRSFSVPGGNDRKLPVVMRADALGSFTVPLVITSNDTAHPSVTVTLRADVVDPPAISVRPDSFSFRIASGDSSRDSLTIRNSGLGTLHYTLRDSLVAPWRAPITPGVPRRVISADARPWGANAPGLRESERSGVARYKPNEFANLPVLVTDPAGDAAGVDAVSLNGAVWNDTLWLQVETATKVDPSSFHGYISLDVDQNVSTGRHPPAFGMGKSSQDVGAEFEVYLANVASGIVYLYDAMTSGLIGICTAYADSYKVTTGIPMGFLSTNGHDINLCGLFGGPVGIMDWVPDAGHGTLRQSSPWLSQNVSSGTVAPGDSAGIRLNVKTGAMDGGSYRGDVIVAHDDPSRGEMVLPVRLRVIGKPSIVVQADTLDFHDGYIAYPDTLYLRIANSGTDTLHISGISSNAGEFTAAGPTAFSIPLRSHRDVKLAFTAAGTGPAYGTLTVLSDDSLRPSLSLPMKGNGIHPPVISLSPDSLSYTLNGGDSTSSKFTITNSGQGTLNFSIIQKYLRQAPGPAEPFLLKTPPGRRRPAGALIDSSLKVLTFYTGNYQAILLLDSLHSNYTLADPAFFDTVDLAGYDMLFVPSLSSPTMIQHLIDRKSDITSFVSSGGSVVALSEGGTNAWGWVPLDATGTLVGGCFDQIHIVDPLHEAMDSLTDMGLSTWSCSYHGYYPTFDPQLAVLAVGVDAGNAPVVLAGSLGRGRIYLTCTDNENHLYRHEAVVMAAKAFAWAGAGGGWLSEDVVGGVVSPGASKDVHVKVKTRSMDGGTYFADLSVRHNDPSKKDLLLPVRLRVVGQPGISVSSDSLDFRDGYISYPDSMFLRVTNTGSDTLHVKAMGSDAPQFRVSGPTVFALPVRTHRDVKLVFTATGTGVVEGTLTIASDDTGRGSISVRMKGNGIHPPIVTISPDSLSFNVNEGDSAVSDLTIGNSGLGTLHYSLSTRYLRRSLFLKETSVRPGVTKPSGNRSFAVKGSVDSSIRVLAFYTYNSSTTVLLDSLHCSYTLVSPQEFDTVSFTGYDVIYVPPLGDPDYIQHLINRKADISSFLTAGGGVTAFYEGGATAWQWVPLPATATMGGGCYDQIHIVDTLHPAMDSLRDADLSSWSCSYHSSFTALDSLLHVLAVGVDAGSAPVVVAGELGAGRIYLSCTDNEYHLFMQGSIRMAEKALNWAGTTANWLSEDPASGSVGPSSSKVVKVKASAFNLGGGTYHAEIIAKHNDPAVGELTLPIMVSVTGRPRIVLSADTVDFGDGYIGYPDSLLLRITNRGSVLLHVEGVHPSLPVFSVGPDTVFDVLPRNTRGIMIRFTAALEGPAEGNLSITSNDPVSPSKTVRLKGNGIQPPVLGVSPDSLSFALNEGESASSTLTVHNSGLGPLAFTLMNGSPGRISPALKGDIGGIISRNSLIARPNAAGALAKNLEPKDVRPARKTPASEIVRMRSQFPSKTEVMKVAVLRSWGATYATSTWDSLNANWGIYGSTEIIIDYAALNKSDITYGDLVLSGANVLVISDAWSSSYNWSFSDSECAAIAEYVVTGHGLVVTSGTLNSAGAPNHQKHIAPILGLDSAISYEWSIASSPLQFVAKGHPLLAGLTEPYTPYDPYTASPLVTHNWSRALKGAEVVAISPDSTTALTAYRSCVYISNIPEHLPNRSDYQLLYNSIVYSSGAAMSWLTEAPTSGVIQPGGSTDIDVRVNSTGLDGGLYRATIELKSNDPARPKAAVPVRMKVTGKPRIVLSADTLDFGDGYIGYADSITLRVTNSGTDTLHVAGISSDAAEFTVVGSVIFDVPLRTYRDVKLKFLATSTGPQSGTLTVTSNDPSKPSLTVHLEGRGVEPPSIALSPSSLAFLLGEGDSASQKFKISNSGPGTLHFSLSETYAGPAERGILSPKKGTLKTLGVPRRESPARDGQGGMMRVLAFYPGNYAVITLLDSLHFNYTMIDPVQFDTVHLTSFTMLFVPSVTSLTTIQHLIDRKADIASFIRSGGGVIALYEGGSNAWQWLPHGVAGAAGGGCYDQIHIVDSLHPAMDSLSDADLSNWSCSYHSNFTSFDSSMHVLAVGVDADSTPVILSGNLDMGRIYLSCTDNENHLYRPETIRMARKAFAWAGSSVGWLSAVPSGGVVNSGSSQDVNVTATALNLQEGTYDATVEVKHNDPSKGDLAVPVRLSVIGRPRIVLSADSIDFSSVFLSYSREETLIVRNAGSLVLSVSSILASDSSFRPDRGALTVTPHGEEPLIVTFTPPDTGEFTGHLTLATNDSSHLILQVPLRGWGAYAPSVTVMPDSFVVSLPKGDSVSRRVTIGNTGKGVLLWQAQVTSHSLEPVLSAARSISARAKGKPPVTAPAIDQGESGAAPRAHSAQGAVMVYRNEGPSSPGADVLVLASADSLTLGDVARYIISSGMFASVTTVDGGLVTPTLNELKSYGAVVVFGWSPWASPGAVGTVLADYIDAGGRVMVGFAANAGSGLWKLTGRFDAEGYWLINPNGFSGGGHYVLGTVLRPDHPVMEGVSTYVAGSKLNPGAIVNPKAELLCTFSDGTPLVAVSETPLARRVDISSPFITNAVTSWGIDTASDARRLILNAVRWLTMGPVSWMRVSPSSGSLASGRSEDVTLTISAGVLAGGAYDAIMSVVSNDPVRPAVQLGIHLDVVLGIREASGTIPLEYRLYTNYPNPFNPSTTIRFDIPTESRITLKVYNMLGQEVRTLLDENRPAGRYNLRWSPGGMPSGLYFCRIAARPLDGKREGYISTQKMVLLK